MLGKEPQEFNPEFERLAHELSILTARPSLSFNQRLLEAVSVEVALRQMHAMQNRGPIFQQEEFYERFDPITRNFIHGRQQFQDSSITTFYRSIANFPQDLDAISRLAAARLILKKFPPPQR